MIHTIAATVFAIILTLIAWLSGGSLLVVLAILLFAAPIYIVGAYAISAIKDREDRAAKDAQKSYDVAGSRKSSAK